MKHYEKKVKKTYAEMVEREWNRTVRDEFHKLESDTTIHFIKKYFPKKGLILDAGGGPGRYTIALAKMGYDIVLLDLTPKNLHKAKHEIKKNKLEKKVKDIIQGSITDLSMLKPNTFDAVICLGNPLGHVYSQKAREKAIAELARVAKKNAPIFVSVISKYGCIKNAPSRWPEDVKNIKNWRQLYKKGEDHNWVKTGYSHFFTTDELEKLMSKKTKIIQTVGLEGLVARANMDDFNKNCKDKTFYKNWLEMHYNTCTDKLITNISEHILVIGRKK